jgi:Uma2 family endonuclease
MRTAEPTTRRWTVDEYHRAADAGVFGPEERLELIDGEIFRMSPQKGPHMAATRLALSALERVFRAGWVVLVQMPLILAERSQPEPDLAVVAGEERDLVQGPPRTAALVVEVSDSTLAFDRTRKAATYARAGIHEYWILNLPERQLEVHRDPDPATEIYQEITFRSVSESVSPLAAPTASIAVRDLLP